MLKLDCKGGGGEEGWWALNPCRPFIVSASGRRAYNMRRTFFSWAFSRQAHHLAEPWPRVKQSSLQSNVLAGSHLKCVSNCKICTSGMGESSNLYRWRERSADFLHVWLATLVEDCAHGRYEQLQHTCVLPSVSCRASPLRAAVFSFFFFFRLTVVLGCMIMETKERLHPSQTRSLSCPSCDE